MEIFSYIRSCIAGISSDGTEGVLSIAALALLGAFALILVWKMLRGFFIGARRQLLSTCTVLVVMTASVIITKLLSPMLLNLISLDNIGEAATKFFASSEKMMNYVNAIEELPPETVRYILSVPISVMVFPLLFVTLYFLMRLILSFFGRLFRKLFDARKPDGFIERLAGLCLATVEAVIVFSIIVTPITSIMDFADETVAAISESSENNAEETADESAADPVTLYNEQIKPKIGASPILLFANRSVNDGLTKTRVAVSANAGDSDIRDEFIDAVGIVVVEVPKLKGANFKAPNAEDKRCISVLVDKASDNKIVSTVLSGVVSTTAKVADLESFGIKIEPPLDAAVNDVVELLKTCTTVTLKSDLNLIKDIYFLLADEKILENIGDEDLLLETLTAKREGEDKNAVQKLIALINENERTKPLITTLTKLSITMLANQFGNSEFIPENTYESLKDTMNEVLSVKNNEYETHEEYIDALSTTLDSNLRDNGIEIEKEIVTGIAEYIDTTYPEVFEFTDEEFNDVLLSYFDAYLDYVNNGTIPEDILPPNVNPEDIPKPDEIPDLDSIPGLEGIIDQYFPGQGETTPKN